MLAFLLGVFFLFMLRTPFCVDGWMNAMDQPLSFTCPSGTAIYEINSKHDNYFEDRVFEILCRVTGKTPKGCQWTDYVNNFEQDFNFQCPNNGILFGMESYHDQKSEDRRWKFNCCTPSGTTLSECYRTPKSKLDQTFSVFAPENFAIRGVSSIHNDFYQDRAYIFEICRLRSG